MHKAVSTEGSAYETFPGISREEAAEKGLGIVEYNYSGGSPTPVYGRYKDAPKGSAIGVTVPKADDTEVIGAGSVGPAPAEGGGKGDTFKPSNPIAKPVPGTNPHADGGEPAKLDDQLEAEPKPAAK